jgi:centromeric protein E
MAAAIPRPSRPSYGPPNTALPALPPTKTRKSTGAIPTLSEFNRSEAAPSLPRSGLRAPSTSGIPSSIASSPGGSSTALPKLRNPGVNDAGKSIRKTISINSFPHPPRGGVRTASLPPSPLSGGQTAPNGSKGDSDTTSPLTPGPSRKLKRSTTSASAKTSYVNGAAPSLLNGSGDSRSISSGPGARGSDGLLSLPSPPQSRSSSAQGSYSTSATTFDDNGEPRGRELGGEADADKRSSKHPESKGNVIVSVRVRPDASGNNKADGEWMVDGRQSLVAYRGKEGGDYYYGEYLDLHILLDARTNLVQIMFLRLATTTPRSTILQRRDSSAGSWRGTTELYLRME